MYRLNSFDAKPHIAHSWQAPHADGTQRAQGREVAARPSPAGTVQGRTATALEPEPAVPPSAMIAGDALVVGTQGASRPVLNPFGALPSRRPFAIVEFHKPPRFGYKADP